MLTLFALLGKNTVFGNFEKVLLRKLRKLDYFSRFSQKQNTRLVFARFGQKHKVVLRKLRKRINLAYFSKGLTSSVVIFHGFGGKTEFHDNFTENFRKTS